MWEIPVFLTLVIKLVIYKTLIHVMVKQLDRIMPNCYGGVMIIQPLELRVNVKSYHLISNFMGFSYLSRSSHTLHTAPSNLQEGLWMLATPKCPSLLLVLHRSAAKVRQWMSYPCLHESEIKTRHIVRILRLCLELNKRNPTGRYMIIFHLSCLFFLFLFFLFVSSSLIQVISPSFFCSSFESQFKLFHCFLSFLMQNQTRQSYFLSHFLCKTKRRETTNFP